MRIEQLSENVCMRIDFVGSKETGEIVEVPFGTEIITPKIHKERNRSKENEYVQNYNDGNKFVKEYLAVIDTLCTTLSHPDLCFYTCIKKYVSYKDNVLRTGGHRNGSVLNMHDLASLLNMDYNYVTKRISSLRKLEVVAIVNKPIDDMPTKTVKAIVMNPWICSKGNDMLKEVLNEFLGSKWAEITAKSKIKTNNN